MDEDADEVNGRAKVRRLVGAMVSGRMATVGAEELRRLRMAKKPSMGGQRRWRAMRLRWRPRSIRRQVAFGITLVTWLAVAQYSVFASPEDRAPELSRDLARAAARKDWDAAVAVARQLAAARPDSALDAYNLACMQSRAGHGEEAIAALTRSAELGFAYTSTLLRDEDLDAIRAQAGFNVALDRVRRNNAAALKLLSLIHI